jgi:uncharacterized protein YbjT (DUF2867 family)
MDEQTTTAVFGGTGKTGRRVVAHLRARGEEVRPLGRRTAVPFDWDDEAAWSRALRGARAAYVAIPPALEDQPRLAERLARRAADLGTERLVLLSVRMAAWGGGLAATLSAVEDAVRSAGLPTTVLRPTWFQQGFTEDFFAAQLEHGGLRLPEGELLDPFIDVGDIAEVAVTALTAAEPLDRVVDLSGPRILSFREATDIIGAAAGRTFTYEAVSNATFADDLRTAGVPDAEVDELVELFALLRDPRNHHLSTGVQDILGRPPRDLAIYAADAAATGAWAAPVAA